MNELWQTLIIGASALLGPLVGIQTQKYFERRQSKKRRKADIFRTLLISKGDKASPECVKALNLLLLDFPDANQAFKNAINNYKNQVNTPIGLSEAEKATWSKEIDTRFNTLLREVAENYDKSLIKDKEFESFDYYPQELTNKKDQEFFIRRELSEILSNKKSLNITVTNLPTSSEVEP